MSDNITESDELQPILKPNAIRAIRQYAKSFEGTLTGEAFKDLFGELDKRDDEISKLREDKEKLIKWVRDELRTRVPFDDTDEFIDHLVRQELEKTGVTV